MSAFPVFWQENVKRISERGTGSVPAVIPAVVSASWVLERLESLTLADVRWFPDGSEPTAAFSEGHLPGAVLVDLDLALSAPPGPGGRHPLPSPGEFARSMSELGVGEADLVVCYDDAGGVYAARLVWMLRVTGHGAALLDGGLANWPGPLESGPPRKRSRATFGAVPWPSERLATAADASDRSQVVLDARDGSRYRGEPHPLDRRHGHIPGARSAPCRENLDEGGFLLPPDELRRRFEQAGVSEGSQPVAYCGSGVTACHLLLALEHAGLGEGRLYPGSWSQWCEQPGADVVTGAEPG